MQIINSSPVNGVADFLVPSVSFFRLSTALASTLASDFASALVSDFASALASDFASALASDFVASAPASTVDFVSVEFPFIFGGSSTTSRCPGTEARKNLMSHFIKKIMRRAFQKF